ncbi:MAG TPA: prephenate dehydrogenase/arogenate dehydrogenase family protein [Anaerolineales bacterium]|nr:prephenate dehydrogenase/arogenate dehydrogenase family protein [Anaerolineales bacterium]
MSQPDFNLAESKIAIIGLGLMGGSLALALKGRCAALYGIDPHLPTLELALSQQIVDSADSDPAKLLPEADLVILSAPVSAILTLLERLPSFTSNPCVVMDLGSTKKLVVESMSRLPERFDPIGGHPICGKERLGLENADVNLYKDASFVVTSLERTTHRAKSAAAQIISTIGANLIEMTAEEHDRVLASTSHLPFLLSSVLANSTPPEFIALIGPGFRSTSRLAGTPSHMMMGVLRSNRDNVLNAIRAFRMSLDEIESVLQNENYAELENILDQSCNSYLTLVG